MGVAAVAQKKKTLEFALTEDDILVRAVLAVDGSRILDFEIEEAPSVTARHPRAGEGELLETAVYWSRRNPAMGKPAAWLAFYVASREKDVVKQILEIRKALRKIAGAMRNAKMAKKLKKGLEK
jgi:hypothetical protein